MWISCWMKKMIGTRICGKKEGPMCRIAARKVSNASEKMKIAGTHHSRSGINQGSLCNPICNKITISSPRWCHMSLSSYSRQQQQQIHPGRTGSQANDSTSEHFKGNISIDDFRTTLFFINLQAKEIQQIKIFSFSSPLYYVNAEHFMEELYEKTECKPRSIKAACLERKRLLEKQQQTKKCCRMWRSNKLDVAEASYSNLFYFISCFLYHCLPLSLPSHFLPHRMHQLSSTLSTPLPFFWRWFCWIVQQLLTLSLPVTRIWVNYSTVYNDTLVAKGWKDFDKT